MSAVGVLAETLRSVLGLRASLDLNRFFGAGSATRTTTDQGRDPLS